MLVSKKNVENTNNKQIKNITKIRFTKTTLITIELGFIKWKWSELSTFYYMLSKKKKLAEKKIKQFTKFMLHKLNENSFIELDNSKYLDI